MKNLMNQISLDIYLNPVYTALVTRFAEQSAKAFGLERPDALKLTLACEEIFTYLCSIGNRDKPVTFEAKNGIYYIQIKILFSVANFDPRAFNLTAKVSIDDKNSVEEMGLLIASRSVDRFSIIHDKKEEIELLLVKEKKYPELSPAEPLLTVKPLDDFSIQTPAPEALKILAKQITSFYRHTPYPPEFNFPGKLVDMVASGEYKALVAADSHGTIGGGIFWQRWHRINNKVIECAGPYVFGQPPKSGMAEKLMDALISDIAKTDAIFLINRLATRDLPPYYFEPLGSVDYQASDGTLGPWQVYFRFLKEDTGSRVWAHPELQDFLEKQYKSLSFAREIMPTNFGGETRPQHSVFATQFVRSQNDIILFPVWDGVDVSINLAKHVKTILDEGLRIIFLIIDLGYAWQANLTPALKENNFIPRIILPYAGKSDIVVFQYREGA